MNYSNNAFSVLNGGISASDTVITLAAGTGARFPASNFNVTLIGYDGLGNEASWEICLCSSRTGDVLTVARGQEGTTAVAWPGATRIEARLTAGAAAEMATKSGTETLTNKTLTTPVINGMTGGTQVVDLGSGQFYKDVSGNVGIGTSTPGALYSMDHLLAMMKNQNGMTRVTLVNNTVGANAVAMFKIIGGSPNSFFDLWLADNNGAPYAALSTGSGVQRLSFSVGGGEAARIDASKKSTLYGDLELSGAGRRITGDFSNATLTSRAAFQTSVANGSSVPLLLPNGTGQISGITAVGASDPTNAPYASMYFSGVNAVYEAGAYGTGTNPNMVFSVGGAERLRIDTSGNLLVNGVGTGDTPTRAKTTVFSSFGNGLTPNIAVSPAGGIGLNQKSGIALYATFGGGTTDYNPRRAADIWSSFGGGIWGSERLSFGVGNGTAGNDAFAVTIERLAIDGSGNVLVTGSGGLGYGVGSGGTVTQPTSKSTAVTLNKPSGRITMHNEPLAAGASVTFTLISNAISPSDVVVVCGVWISVDPASYRIEVARMAAPHHVHIRVTNITTGSLSEALEITFATIKGEIS